MASPHQVPILQPSTLVANVGLATTCACFLSLPPRSRVESSTATSFHPPCACEMTRNAGVSKRFGKNRDFNDDDNNIVISIVERLATTFTKPTPGITPSLAIGYPLALLASAVILPVTSSLLLAFFFVLFSFIGRKFILEDYFEEAKEERGRDNTQDVDEDDEESRPTTDLLAFGAAIVSSGLLSPSSNHIVLAAPAAVNNGGGNLPILLGAIGLGSVILLLLTEGTSKPPTAAAEETEESFEKEIMDIWDREVRDEGRDSDNENKR
jgi:hypothetical protein